MKERKEGMGGKNVSAEKPASIDRRKVLKKAAYVAPTIVVLGVLSPIDAVALPSPPPPPGSPLSPLYQPQDDPRKK